MFRSRTREEIQACGMSGRRMVGVDDEQGVRAVRWLVWRRRVQIAVKFSLILATTTLPLLKE